MKLTKEKIKAMKKSFTRLRVKMDLARKEHDHARIAQESAWAWSLAEVSRFGGYRQALYDLGIDEPSVNERTIHRKVYADLSAKTSKKS
jgi:hypothetical protein